MALVESNPTSKHKYMPHRKRLRARTLLTPASSPMNSNIPRSLANVGAAKQRITSCDGTVALRGGVGGRGRRFHILLGFTNAMKSIRPAIEITI